MNPESAVISAVCKNKDISVLLQENVDELFVSHKDIWEGVKSYYYKFKSVPDVSVLTERYANFEPVAIKAETGFYLDELKNDYLSAKIKGMLLSAGGNLKTNAAARVLEDIQKEVSGLSRMAHTVRDLDLTDYEDAERHLIAVRERSIAMGGTPGIPTGFKAMDMAYPTGMAPGHLIVVIGWPGRGKRLSVDSMIATPSGWKRYGDISIGDKVIGRSGTPTTVTGVYNRSVGKSYKITFNDKTSIVADPDHLWSIYCGQRGKQRDNLVTLTTQQILDRGLFRDRVGHKEYKAILPLVEPVQYDEVDLPLEPYTIGALIGDGSYSLKSWDVTLSNNDEEIATLVSSRLPEYRMVERKPGTSRRWSIHKLHRLFRENGWCAIRSDKRIPEIYMTAHYEARLELLRGLMDTDGHSGNGSRATFSQSNEVLAHQVAELVRSLGGVAKVTECNTRPGQYVVTLWTPDNPFNLERKSSTYNSRPMFKAFESIEPWQDTEMMCISVDAEDSLYVTQDYTVTHNTWATSYLACKAWEQGFKPMIVSLEMSPENMRDRIYTMLGSGLFRASDFSRGSVNVDDFGSWARKKFTDKRGFVLVSNEGQADVTPSTVQGKIDQHRPDLVICDYHQLFNDSKRSNSEVERNRNISREFKLLAIRNNLPVIDITAATASDTSDHDNPPMLNQVAWSKAIEYDADMAFAVHRTPNTNIIEIVSRKSRHGTDFDFYLDWDIDRGIVTELYDIP